jgi:hypothetical protein
MFWVEDALDAAAAAVMLVGMMGGNSPGTLAERRSMTSRDKPEAGGLSIMPRMFATSPILRKLLLLLLLLLVPAGFGPVKKDPAQPCFLSLTRLSYFYRYMIHSTLDRSIDGTSGFQRALNSAVVWMWPSKHEVTLMFNL